MAFRILLTQPHQTVFLYPTAVKAWRKVKTLMRNGALFQIFCEADGPISPDELERRATRSAGSTPKG